MSRYEAEIKMRYSYGLSDYRMICPKPKIIPILYKQRLKDKIFIVKKIGLIGAVKLYMFERRECKN